MAKKRGKRKTWMNQKTATAQAPPWPFSESRVTACTGMSKSIVDALRASIEWIRCRLPIDETAYLRS